MPPAPPTFPLSTLPASPLPAVPPVPTGASTLASTVSAFPGTSTRPTSCFRATSMALVPSVEMSIPASPVEPPPDSCPMSEAAPSCTTTAPSALTSTSGVWASQQRLSARQTYPSGQPSLHGSKPFSGCGLKPQLATSAKKPATETLPRIRRLLGPRVQQSRGRPLARRRLRQVAKPSSRGSRELNRWRALLPPRRRTPTAWSRRSCPT